MTKGTHRSSSFGMKCVQCSNELIAPEGSEHWNDRHVRHLWHCPKCDCSFKTAVLISAVSSNDIMAMDDILPPLRVA
jgi:hypothetical protein